MKTTLVKAFFVFLLSMFLFVFVFALFFPNRKKVDLTEVDFSTTSSSELYFKNMRSYFYDKENREDANFILYRIDSRETDSTKNKLNFALVMNWLQNECYIIAEGGNDTLNIEWHNDKGSGVIQLKEKDSYSNYVFAAQLFEKLNQDATVSIQQGREGLLLTEKEKLSLKTTLKDYFKLVGKL